MTSERLFQILNLLDEDLIEEAGSASSAAAPERRDRRPFLRLAAACLALICVGGAVWSLRGDLNRSASFVSAPGDAAGDGGSGIAHDTEPLSVEGTSFMSYAGPVFPLTLTGDAEGVTAERTTTWDFAPDSYQDGTPRQWGAAGTDSYLLMNHTTGDIVAMASYPVAGTLADLPEERPVILLNGEEPETVLQAGAYAGSFRDAGVPDGSTWNLAQPDNWTDYQTLLEDGTYLASALAGTVSHTLMDSTSGEILSMASYPIAGTPAKTLALPVTVYEFSDYVLPDNAPRAATQAIHLKVDTTKTSILTYGFNGYAYDADSGENTYDFFVQGGGQPPDTRYLIVLGEDIGDYRLQGYQTGDSSPGNELDGVSCTVERYETTLDTVLTELCRRYQASYTEQWQRDYSQETGLFDLISLELFRDKAAELMTQYGVLAGDAKTDRYSDGRLDEVLSETLTQERVLYYTFPVIIPAGGSVEVSISFYKEPSFDFGCSGSDNVGLQGYDYVTQLGSSLTFTQQTAILANTEGIEIHRQNFGFDLENGVMEVTLDPKQAHYYLEIRPMESN